MRKVSIVIAVCFITALVQGQSRDLDAIMKEIRQIWMTPGTGLGARGAGFTAVERVWGTAVDPEEDDRLTLVCRH